VNFVDGLSFQLYSARKFPPLDGQLAALAKLGYRNVEPFGALFAEADALKAGLDRNGLAVPTSHIGIEVFRTNFASVAPLARRFGVKTIVIPYLQPPDRPKDAAGWTAFGRELQGYAERLKGEGFPLAWHNHDFEMVPLADGKVPMDLVFAAAPDLLWECDVGWIVRAGVDPLPWLERYRDRIRAVHLKDLAPEGTVEEDGWADVGQGRIDWKRLLPALAATKAVMIVEHDNPADFERFARRSREAVAKW
jgi:sugar phosphate isomerase/epimerase